MAEKHRRVRAAAVTGVGQLLGLVGSTLIGILVAGTLPPSPRVDGFFGANQVYALALYLGQAVRVTAPALLVRAGLRPERLARGTLGLTAGTVAFMALAALVGPLLVAPAARDAFTSDLLVLAPAAGVHVACGTLAARMAVARSFGWPAAAYASGSVVSAVLLIAVIGDQGAAALAPCLAIGALTVGIVMTIGYRRSQPAIAAAMAAGPEPIDPDDAYEFAASPGAPDAPVITEPAPRARAFEQDPSAAGAVRQIGLGAVPPLSLQFLITVVTLAAGHVVSGGTALLSYAFLALFAFTTIAITPMSVVLAPELAERWDGSREALVSVIRRATRLSVVFAVPLIAVAFLAGRPVAGRVLTALSDDDLTDVFSMLAVLTPTLIFTAAATVAIVGITASAQLGRLARVLGVLCAAVAISGTVIGAASVPLLAVAVLGALFALAFAVGALLVAIGDLTWPTLATVLRADAPVFLPPLALTAALTPLTQDDVVLGFALCVPVLALHFAIVAWLRRDVALLLIGAARERTAA